MYSTRTDKLREKNVLLCNWKGEIMYKLLNEEEKLEFAKKYLPKWIQDIVSVSLIKYRGVKEYLVNDHYLVIIKGFKVIHKDLQELDY